MNFISELNVCVNPNMEVKPYLIHDSHPAYTVKESKETMNEYFQPLRYSKYSCRFNSIVSLFALVNNEFWKINVDLNLK